MICQGCKKPLTETGLNEVREMIWKQNEETKEFNFAYSEMFLYNEGQIMCDHCGEYIDAEMLQLLDIQEVNEVEDGSVVETSNEEISVTCDDCGASFAETGVYQVWNVYHKWSEEEQRFVFDQAYQSSVKEYATCCNECNHPVDENLEVNPIKVVGM